MTMKRLLAGTALCLVTIGLALGPATAQQQQTDPPTTPPAATTDQPAAEVTKPAPEQTPIISRVIEVRGDVQYASLGSDEWRACKVDDEYPQQTMVRTGIRSSIKLQIGDDDTYTAVVIESASKTVISEAFQSQGTKRVRVGVGYGRMRAGVVEGGLKSDFTVDSPVATLSKRGTWDFGLGYERGTDQFEIFLLDQGLVDAFNKVTGKHHAVLPREVVTQVMRRWANESQMLRNVPIPDYLGQGDIEVAFNRLRQDGLRVLDPQGGRTVLIDLSSAQAQQDFAQLALSGLAANGGFPGHGVGRHKPVEGWFGTGRGDQLVPIMIAADSALSKKGAANEGTYRFRRSALESWLRGYKAGRN